MNFILVYRVKVFLEFFFLEEKDNKRIDYCLELKLIS